MRLTVVTVAIAALIAASPVAFAQGVSSNAPGHKTKNYKGSPGASHWAPGQRMLRDRERGPKTHLVPAHPTMLPDVRPPDTSSNTSRASPVWSKAASLRGDPYEQQAMRECGKK